MSELSASCTVSILPPHPTPPHPTPPPKFAEPLNIGSCSPELLIRQLEMLLTIRFAEEQIGDWVLDGTAKCPCHLGIGQEAVAVGVASALRKSDRVFGTHRSHTQFLALGGSVDALLAEVLGKATGCSKGMGGSMHLYDGPNGFYGSVPIVGGTIPLAVGAGLAAKMDGSGDVAVAFFGDGAAEEGVIHESLNLAANYGIPVVFVCENNVFASHLHISLRQPSDKVSRFADAHCISSFVVDGNDVVSVSKTAQEAVGFSRETGKPAFIEAVTYRWRGHVGASEDNDVGVKRNEDLVYWKGRCPIIRLAKVLDEAGLFSGDELCELQGRVRERVRDAAVKAISAPYPDIEQLLGPVYYTERTK